MKRRQRHFSYIGNEQTKIRSGEISRPKPKAPPASTLPSNSCFTSPTYFIEADGVSAYFTLPLVLTVAPLLIRPSGCTKVAYLLDQRKINFVTVFAFRVNTRRPEENDQTLLAQEYKRIHCCIEDPHLRGQY